MHWYQDGCSCYKKSEIVIWMVTETVFDGHFDRATISKEVSHSAHIFAAFGVVVEVSAGASNQNNLGNTQRHQCATHGTECTQRTDV